MALIVPVAGICVAMAWTAWQVLSDTSAEFAGPGGIYFLLGALSTSYMVTRLTPVWAHRIRGAVRGEGDRASQILVGLWELFPTLWMIAILAGPATLLWPVALPLFRRLEKGRVVDGDDERELASFRSSIELEARRRRSSKRDGGSL